MKNSTIPLGAENNPAHPADSAGKFKFWLAELAWQAAPPLFFLLGMLGLFPYWNSFWLVNDEGYNLMKALMVLRGYDLYSQIWSDQAPLLTYILAGLFRLNGASLLASRYLILLFSCVLVWAVVQYLRLTWGKLHAFVGAVILVLLPSFLTVSAAVLVGQPSLSFAVLAMLALAGWHLRRKPVFLILSAAALSLSLLTKLFTGFLAPIFLAGLLAGEYFHLGGNKKDWLGLIRPALLWGLVLGGLTLGLGLLMVNPADAVQLVQPHLAAATAAEYPLNEQLSSIHFYLLPAWPVLLAALAGAVLALKRKHWLALYPLAWMVVAYLILLVDRPVWWHHQMLVTIPASILAAGMIGEGLRALIEVLRDPSRVKASWSLLAAGLVSLVLVLAVRIPDVAAFLQHGTAVNEEERNHAEEKFMRKVFQFAPQTSWMVTDMPMFSFQAGISSPPDLTVISWKRLASGGLTEEDILQTLRKFRPEQVLFGRFHLPSVEQYLAENYRVVHQRLTMKLYIRRDLQK